MSKCSFYCYGASDDLFEVRGDIYEEVGAFDVKRYLHVFRKGYEITDGFYIKYDYEPNGCWSVAAFPTEEDMGFPDWVKFITTYDDDKCSYSAILHCELDIGRDEIDYCWLNEKMEVIVIVD